MKQILLLFMTILAVSSPLKGMVARHSKKPGITPVHQRAPQVPARSIVDVRHLKHVHRVIKPEYAHLSPLVGASLINSHYLKNVHQFAPNHPTTRLLNDPKLGLFHLQNTQFRDTQSLSMPGKSLNPQLIGNMLGHLHTGKLSDPQIQADLIKDWKKSLHDNFKASISTEKLSQFLKLVQDSKRAENETDKTRLFLPNITEAALTAFLYRKSTQKEELFDYLNALNKHLPILHKNLDEKTLHNNYTYDELRSAFQNLKNSKENPLEQAERIEKDFEQSICALMNQNSSKEIPPQVLQASYGYQDKPKVPNCTETALQDLCNILLADPSTGLFNLELLPATIQPIQELRDFYTKYPSYTMVNNSQVGQAWMNLLSNRKSIMYIKKNYEVNSFSENILNLLNIIFNIKAKSWKEFGQLLSTKHRTISCEEKINNNKQIVSFLFASKEFDLIMSPNVHAHLHFPNRNNNDGPVVSHKIWSAWKDKNKEKTNQSTYLLSLIPLSSLNYIPFENVSHDLLACFSFALENPNHITKILRQLARGTKENPVLTDTVIKLVKMLPQDDNHFKNAAFEAIVISGAFQKSKDVLDFINTHINTANPSDLGNLLEYCLCNPEHLSTQIKTLLKRGAIPKRDSLERAIIHKCNYDIIEELVKFGCPLFGQNNTLALAISFKRPDVAQLILNTILAHPSNSIDGVTEIQKLHLLNALYFGKTPLEKALTQWFIAKREMKKEYIGLIKSIVKIGSTDLVISNKFFQEFIDCALSETDKLADVIELTKIFLQVGGNINSVDESGTNALGKALCSTNFWSEEKKEYHYKIIELLLEGGIDRALQNGKEIDPLDFALKIKDKKLENLLRAHLAKQNGKRHTEKNNDSLQQNASPKKWHQKIFEYLKV